MLTQQLCHSIWSRMVERGEVLLGQGQSGNLGNMLLGQLSLLLNAWPAPQPSLKVKEPSPDGLT